MPQQSRLGQNIIGREINATCYSLKEIRKKVEDENHFVTSVLKGEKTFLKGDKDELESFADKQDSAAA